MKREIRLRIVPEPITSKAEKHIKNMKSVFSKYEKSIFKYLKTATVTPVPKKAAPESNSDTVEKTALRGTAMCSEPSLYLKRLISKKGKVTP